ncbi:MAG: PAS domain S-box protein [Halanaeroarchaeum sp.]
MRHAVTVARLPSQEDENAIVLRDVPRETAPDTEQARTFAGFQDAIESAGHGIMITDRRGTIQYVNAGFEEITGYSRAEAVGQTPHLLSSGLHDKEFYATLWGTILAGRTWRSHIVNRHRNGRLIHIDHTIAPITDDEDIEGFVAVFTEVTGERVRTSQLQVLYRVLRHNLRTETTKIRGFTDLVRRRTDDEAVGEYLDVIERAGQTLGDLSDKTRPSASRCGSATTATGGRTSRGPSGQRSPTATGPGR